MVLIWASFLLSGVAIAKCAAPIDWIERSPNGAYELAYATGDEGSHFKTEAATADNTVTGKFGYRDPASGGILQTSYTAGRRGFRPRGAHIARRISLSQAGPIRPQDDGQYHPEFDGADPSESQAYDFSFSTRDVVKEEHADERGDVRGRYSYLDDVGVRRSVEYAAGAEKGFNVLNAVPDSIVQAQNSPLVFQGKRPVDKIRGLTAVQKSPDGSYRFAASGPDHKRAEVKDAFGNTRGSYSYIDDRGQTRTVEYIAGPNIGFQIVNGRRPILPALFPNIPEVSSTPASLSPFFPDSPSTISPLFPDVSTTTSSFFSDLFPDSPSTKPPPLLRPSTPQRPPPPNSSGRPTPEPGFPGGQTTLSSGFPGRPSPPNSSGRPTPEPGFPGGQTTLSSGFPGRPSPTSTPTSTLSPEWTPSTPEPWLDDFGSLQQQLFPGGGQVQQFTSRDHMRFPAGGREPHSSAEAHETGNCCKSSWHSGGPRGRAVRAHVQSIDITEDRHMSPGEALRMHS